MDTIVEYIWLDADNKFRSKTKIMKNRLISNVDQLPCWNYDGSSTNQATTETSEVILRPIFLCNDPFREKNHKLAYCGTYDTSGNPLINNHYDNAYSVFDCIETHHYQPWFGMEQEFFIFDSSTNAPINFDIKNTQGKYYCSIDEHPKKERDIMEEFIERSSFAGINVCGINAEVAQGQWEFQVGPCQGILIGHTMMIARYILNRVAHLHSCKIDYSPKALGNDWNGSGCHTNYSTKFTRCGDEGKSGLEVIYEYISELEKVHSEMMKSYGDENELRMSGSCETADYNVFTHSIGGRNTSIRIGNDVARNTYGYFEDRRPASNCDPYLVSSLIFYHTCTKHD